VSDRNGSCFSGSRRGQATTRFECRRGSRSRTCAGADVSAQSTRRADRVQGAVGAARPKRSAGPGRGRAPRHRGVVGASDTRRIADALSDSREWYACQGEFQLRRVRIQRKTEPQSKCPPPAHALVGSNLAAPTSFAICRSRTLHTRTCAESLSKCQASGSLALNFQTYAMRSPAELVTGQVTRVSRDVGSIEVSTAEITESHIAAELKPSNPAWSSEEAATLLAGIPSGLLAQRNRARVVASKFLGPNR
jgi:hypothetical protein